GVSTVSAAATACSPERIRKRQPARRVADPPPAVIPSRTCTGRGSSAERGRGAPRREGVRASRTAVGEESAVRTERSAGAGAAGTCRGMVGRLSFAGTVARGRGVAGRGGRRRRGGRAGGPGGGGGGGGVASHWRARWQGGGGWGGGADGAVSSRKPESGGPGPSP